MNQNDRDDSQSGTDLSLPSWERRDELGVLKAFFKLRVEYAKKPESLFRSMPKTGGLLDPTLLAVLGILIELWFFLLFGCCAIAFQLFYRKYIPALYNHTFFMRTIDINNLPWLGMALFSLPMLALLLLAGQAWYCHNSMRRVSAIHEPFETTYRVLCYAVGSAMGFVVSVVLQVVLSGIALTAILISVNGYSGLFSQTTATVAVNSPPFVFILAMGFISVGLFFFSYLPESFIKQSAIGLAEIYEIPIPQARRTVRRFPQLFSGLTVAIFVLLLILKVPGWW